MREREKEREGEREREREHVYKGESSEFDYIRVKDFCLMKDTTHRN